MSALISKSQIATKSQIEISQRELFLNKLRPFCLDAEIEDVEGAYRLAKYGHRNQKRKNGARVFDHPRAVATIIIDELGIMDYRLVVASLLHDIDEDSFIMSLRHIERLFSRDVARWVMLLTKTGMTEQAFYGRLIKSTLWEPMLIKLADRLNNLRSLDGLPREFQEEQAIETHMFIMPVCKHLYTVIPHEYKAHATYMGEKITQECALYYSMDAQR